MMMTRTPARSGFTLPEMLVVLILVGIVGGIALAGLNSGLTTARIGTERASALSDLQLAVSQIGRDLRVADPLLLDTGDAFATKLGAEVERDGSSRRLEWQVTGNSGGTRTLVRAVTTDPGTGEAGRRGGEFLATLSNVDDQQPVFTYFDDSGSPVCEVGSTGGCEPHRVVVTLQQQLDGQDRPVEVTTTITVGNTSSHEVNATDND